MIQFQFLHTNQSCNYRIRPDSEGVAPPDNWTAIWKWLFARKICLSLSIIPWTKRFSTTHSNLFWGKFSVTAAHLFHSTLLNDETMLRSIVVMMVIDLTAKPPLFTFDLPHFSFFFANRLYIFADRNTTSNFVGLFMYVIAFGKPFFKTQ